METISARDFEAARYGEVGTAGTNPLWAWRRRIAPRRPIGSTTRRWRITSLWAYSANWRMLLNIDLWRTILNIYRCCDMPRGKSTNHHLDYFPPHGQKAHGHRVLTVFLYLNDVEEGGETHFRDLLGKDGAGSAEGIAIKPKAGRMVIWPSVLNEAPNDKDRRTFHGSLPVKKGIKYGANAWVSCTCRNVRSASCGISLFFIPEGTSAALFS